MATGSFWDGRFDTCASILNMFQRRHTRIHIYTLLAVTIMRMQLLPKSIIRLKKAGNDGGKHDEAPYTEGYLSNQQELVINLSFHLVRQTQTESVSKKYSKTIKKKPDDRWPESVEEQITQV